VLVLLAATTVAASAKDWKGVWVLSDSKLTYHVDHPMHHIQATSTTAKGKAVCDAKGAHVVAAATVKSFASGDTNRDLHMMEVTKGAEFPLVKVWADWSGPLKPGIVKAEVDVEFAGKKAHYTAVPFKIEESKDGTLRCTGTVPATVKDFDIKPPTLLTIPIKNEIPVDVDLTWKRS
jgi:hypothetical protein